MTRSVLLILIGFISLNILPVFIGGSLIILGIVMLVERRWPEQVGFDDKAQSKSEAEL